ncbi:MULTISPECIES: histidine phosphatase family protein [Anaeromyxobacter]|uniref:histidine phosphatase family protein n=1 Tax=Anaeromyxobacter TaxID=161492 RepID=UPI001F57F135|nr:MULTISPECIES: histidine phosphatase family protein [unclassified Anaeromyxobacter]
MIAPRPSGATRVILVRHGEAAIEPGRICGRLDPPLSAAGRARIRRVARWLREIEVAAVCASPARRAMQTARLLAAGRSLGIEQVPGLREVDFGAFEGLTWEEARARDPETCAAWLARPHEVTFPGGDGFPGISARALEAMAALRAKHPGETVLVVAHAGVNRAILADALGMEAAESFRIDQVPGAVNLLDWFESGAVVRLVNGGPGRAGPDPAPRPPVPGAR